MLLLPITTFEGMVNAREDDSSVDRRRRQIRVVMLYVYVVILYLNGYDYRSIFLGGVDLI